MNYHSPLAQNTALHLAAIHDSPEVVSCLLSYPEQEILLNKKNHNVLDAALNAERKNVSLAIASHERLVKNVSSKERQNTNKQTNKQTQMRPIISSLKFKLAD